MEFLQVLLKNSAKNHLDENIVGKQPSVCGKHLYKLKRLIMRNVIEKGPKSTAAELKSQAVGKVYPRIVFF